MIDGYFKTFTPYEGAVYGMCTWSVVSWLICTKTNQTKSDFFLSTGDLIVETVNQSVASSWRRWK